MGKKQNWRVHYIEGAVAAIKLKEEYREKRAQRHPFGEQSHLDARGRSAIEKERRNPQRGRRQTNIHRVTSHRKRNI